MKWWYNLTKGENILQKSKFDEDYLIKVLKKYAERGAAGMTDIFNVLNGFQLHKLNPEAPDLSLLDLLVDIRLVDRENEAKEKETGVKVNRTITTPVPLDDIKTKL